MDWQRRECESLNWDDEIIAKKMSQLPKSSSATETVKAQISLSYKKSKTLES